MSAANTEALGRLLGLWQAEEDRTKGPRRTPLESAQIEAERTRLYAEGAFKRELDKLAGTQPGGRSNQTFRSAAAVGNLVGAGWVARLTAEAALLERALAIGLSEEEARGHIRRGLDEGITTPRQWQPETNGTNGLNFAQPASNGTAETVFDQPIVAPAIPAQPAEQQWEPPIPLDAPPAAMPFPLSVLPVSLRQYVEECAWATNTPVDFTAVPMLAMAGGAIGNSRRLQIKESHHQSACLFAGIVGSPGTGKSIPLDFLSRPFEEAERELYRDWQNTCDIWESADPRTRGAKPHLERRIIDDITGEALVRILSQNPRGLTMVRDELAALVTGMNQYKEGGKGSDRQNYLKLWNHATITVDRNKQEGIPLKVYRPFCPIVGAIQPDVVGTMRNEAQQGKKVLDDGLTDRFLFSYPDVPLAIGERWRSISQASIDNWRSTVRTLFDLQMDGELDDRYPELLHLTTDGKEVWVMETDRHAAQINSDDFLEWKRGPWAKFVGYSARLALIVQILRWATGEASGQNVDGQSMTHAWTLVDYFKAHTEKLLVLMGGDPRIAEARKVLSWIIRTGKTSFTRRDAYADLRRSFAAPEALEAPLRLLSEHRFIAPLDEPGKDKGRKAAPKYIVSPLARHGIPEIHGMASD